MGEEEKKPEEKKMATEEEKSKEAKKVEKKTEESEKKAEEGGKNGKDSAGKDGKEEEKAAPPPPPPPPAEIVMRVYMHCEGCARKVKKSLKGFNGVEDVVTDCKNHTVVVKGEKADPLKVVERVHRKSYRHVELLSPIPKPADEAEKPAEPEPPKEEKKEEEPKVVTVVIKVHMHCEACAREIKRRIERMKEVEVATPDLKSSEVTVKGTFDPPKLVEYVYKKTGKHAVIVKQEPAEEPPAEEKEKAKEGKEEKKGEGGEEKKGEDKGDAKAVEKKEGDGGKEVAPAPAPAPAAAAATAEVVEEETKVQVELLRNEFYHYPPKYAMEMYHAYPPQIFSDENPNACSVM